MILLYLLITVIVLVYLFIRQKFSYLEKLGVKHSKPHFIFGNLGENVLLRKSFAEIIRENYNKFKNERYFGIYQFFLPTIVLKDPELIKEITVKNSEHFTDHQSATKDEYDPLWSRNIVSLRGDSWHNIRSIVSPAFTASKMRLMYPLINEVLERWVGHFLKDKNEVIKLEMKDLMARIANDIFASATFGIECDSYSEPDNEFYANGIKTFTFTGLRKMGFFMYGSMPLLAKILNVKIFPDDISSFFRQVVKDSIALREEKGIVRPDIVHLLLQARKGQLNVEDDSGNVESFSSNKEYSTKTKASMKAALELTDEDITSQALIFFFGGFDTSSNTMMFIAYELAINQDIQRRLIEEIDEVAESGDGKLTYDDIMRMKYLDMVISEALRKWPIAIIIDRRCSKDYIIQPKLPHEKAIHVKPDDMLWVSIFGIHRDPEIYPDPEKFDPERFNEENKSKINPSSYLPFGSGPRNCIGSRFALTEIKCMMANFLLKFEFVALEETSVPLVICKSQINITCEGGLWVGLKKR